MNKELEDKLVQKILKHLEEYPIDTWEEMCTSFVSSRCYISPAKKLGLNEPGISSDYIIIRLYSNDNYDDYECYGILNTQLSKILKEETKRRQENFLFKYQKKERETLSKFLEEDF
jgi:hypothetical protein